MAGTAFGDVGDVGAPRLANEYFVVPVVPHKAVAEVSRIGNV